MVGFGTGGGGGLGGREGKGKERTAWPLERGWMSRKAKVLSDSKSFIEGISPVKWGHVSDGSLLWRYKRIVYP